MNFPLRKIIRDWHENNLPWHAAALSYYTLFSMIPIATLFIALSWNVLGPSAIKGQLSSFLSLYVSSYFADSIEGWIAQSYRRTPQGLATLLNVAILLWGSTNLVTNLQVALHKIWNIKVAPRSFYHILSNRLIALITVVGLSAILIISAIFSATFSILSSNFTPYAQLGNINFFQLLEIILSLCLVTILLAITYWILPERKLPWSAIFRGSAITAILLIVSKYITGWYVGVSNVTTAFGAAGSLVAFLFWVYLTTQIILIGAVIIKHQLPAK